MIRAIKTTYRGVLYQSTLEADWAKNLHEWGIRQCYEPEGLKLPSGENYRCDFYLPRVSTWLEVKGPHNQRISKPAQLANAVCHAPGCSDGHPVERLQRDSACACGFGVDFPYQNVVVARPSVSGRTVFETPHGVRMLGDLVLLTCPVCQQRSFTDSGGLTLCRRCRCDARGGQAFRSGQLPFSRVEPPRGGTRRARGKAA